MYDSRPLSIPVILGTPRQSRLSEHVARVIIEQATAREDVQTELIDVRELPLTSTDVGGFGGTRVVESLLPVMRELGLVTIFWDVNVSSVGKVFDADSQLLDDAMPGRVGKLLGQLVWMARVLRAGRDEVALDAAPKVACSMCGAPMNHHAEKIDYSSGAGGVLQQVNQCPHCGNVELRAMVETAVR